MAYVRTTALLLLSLISQVLTSRVQNGEAVNPKQPGLFVRTFLPGESTGLDLDQDGKVKKVSGGQASEVGVKPGWTLAFVDDRPYSPSWLNQKTKGKTATNKYQQKFQPGTWGAWMNVTGEVIMIYKDGMADQLGLKRGFKIKTIGGKAFSIELLRSFAKGNEPYTVTFEETIASKPYMVTFVKGDLELPLQGETGKCLWKGGLNTELKCCCAQICENGKCGVTSGLFAAYFTGDVEAPQALCSKWKPAGIQEPQVKARKKKCMTTLDAQPGLLDMEARLWQVFEPEKYDCQPLCEAMF